MSVAAIALATLLTLPVQETRLPLGMPPADENPAMAKLAPDDCLLYLRWAGSRTPGEAGASSTEQLMRDPEFQEFVRSLLLQSKTLLEESEFGDRPQGKQLLEQLFAVVPQLLANSGAVFVEEFDPGRQVIKAAVVAEVGELDAELQKLANDVGSAWLSDVAQAEPWGDGMLYRVQLGGDAPDMAFGMRDGLFTFAMGTDVAEDIMRRVETPAPKWLDALEQQFPMQRRALLGHVDLARAIQMAQGFADPDLQKLLAIAGLDRLRSLSFASGFDGGEFVSRTRLAYEGEAPRMLLPVTDTPLSADSFAAVPADAAIALVAHVDFEQFVKDWVAGLTELNPKEAEEIRATFAGTAEEGMPSIEKIMASLGETMTIYYMPHEGGFLGVNAVFEVNDRVQLQLEEEALIKQLEKVFAAGADDVDPWRDNSYRLVQTQFAGETIHYVAANSFWSFSPVAMSWCLRDDQLIISLFPQNIKALLTRPEDAPTLATRTEVASMLEKGAGGTSGNPSAMIFMDSPQLLNSFAPYLQFFALMLRGEMGMNNTIDPGILPSGHLLAQYWTPDVMTMRLAEGELWIESQQTMPGTDLVMVAAVGTMLGAFLDEVGLDAGRALSPAYAVEEDAKMNLKQIALALHNYHAVHNKFPPAYTTDDEGNPLLSWRVQILPYLEENALYEQFHLDEPWDSEHNIKLIEQMPAVFAAPRSEAGVGKTNYLTIRAENSIFPGEKGSRMADITDGTSNTILVVEANDGVAVEWSRPDDLELDPMKPMKSLVGLRKGGFFVALGDGSVWKFPETAGTEELMRWIQRNDGEINELDLWDQ